MSKLRWEPLTDERKLQNRKGSTESVHNRCVIINSFILGLLLHQYYISMYQTTFSADPLTGQSSRCRVKCTLLGQPFGRTCQHYHKLNWVDILRVSTPDVPQNKKTLFMKPDGMGRTCRHVKGRSQYPNGSEFSAHWSQMCIFIVC